MHSVTTRDVAACSFPSWFPAFEKCSIASRIVPLPDDFVAYLKGAGSLFLPPPPPGVVVSGADPRYLGDGEDVEWDIGDAARTAALDRAEEDLRSESSSPTGTHDTPSCFPSVETAILSAIEEYGSVFPRLNWTAPVDAVWTRGSLECATPGDVYLLLKSSDLIQYDLWHAYDDCAPSGDAHDASTPLQLVLRRWSNLHPAGEFRCFVAGRELIAVSQRNCTSHYPHLADEVSDYVGLIARFFAAKVQRVFALTHYTMDVYVDSKRRVWLVDFGVFGKPTLPLAFSWRELHELARRRAPADAPVASDGAGVGHGVAGVSVGTDTSDLGGDDDVDDAGDATPSLGAYKTVEVAVRAEGSSEPATVRARVVSARSIRPRPLSHHEMPDDFMSQEFAQALAAITGNAAPPPVEEEAVGKTVDELVDLMRAASSEPST